MTGLSRMIKSNTTTLGILVCLATAFIAAACDGSSGSVTASGPLTKTEQSESKNDKSRPKSPIREVDFKNFTYPKLPTGKCSMNEVRLINGRYDAPADIAGKHPAV